MYPTGKQTLPAVINFATASTNVIVAGIPGHRINVMKIFMTIVGSTTLTFEDGTTPLTGPMTLSAMALDYDGCPWWTTSIGNGFAINSSSPVQVSGSLQYQLVPG
jgi:hypothetical protein